MRTLIATAIVFCLATQLVSAQGFEYEDILKSANKGLVLNESHEKSVNLFTQCIQMEPEDYRPYFGRASIYTKMEEYDKALDDLQKSMDLNPTHIASYRKSIEILEETGRQEESLRMQFLLNTIESGDQASIELVMEIAQEEKLALKVNAIADEKLEVWLQKDQFETSAMYEERILPENKAKAYTELQSEALNEVLETLSVLQYLEPVNYDADSEQFIINNSILGNLSLNVPLAQARSFNDAVPMMSLENLTASISDSLEIKVLSMSLASGGRTTQYVLDETSGHFITLSESIRFREITQTEEPGPARYDPGKRLALIIGNGEYEYGGTLLNPENDATAMQMALSGLDFEVMLYKNLDLPAMKKAIDDFGLRLRDYDVGLFFYAGHGIQADGENYLIPVDANVNSENDVVYNCVNTGRLLAKMEDARNPTNIIILDACRDNPFERSWSRAAKGGGLAFMNAPSGSLIAYATAPGYTASDGTGANGLFTTSILKHIRNPDLSILQMFQEVRRDVRTQSSGEQIPWETTSLEGDFYFKISER